MKISVPATALKARSSRSTMAPVSTEVTVETPPANARSSITTTSAKAPGLKGAKAYAVIKASNAMSPSTDRIFSTNSPFSSSSASCPKPHGSA